MQLWGCQSDVMAPPRAPVMSRTQNVVKCLTGRMTVSPPYNIQLLRAYCILHVASMKDIRNAYRFLVGKYPEEHSLIKYIM
jgi:hypothetical protein